MANKIKESELKELQEAVGKINNAQMQIGGLELQKHDLMHAAQVLQKELLGIQNNLVVSYGDISVDIQTGDIKENESSKKD